MKERCRKGVPDPLRGAVWPMLLGVTRTPGLYAGLVGPAGACDGAVVAAIEMDATRTVRAAPSPPDACAGAAAAEAARGGGGGCDGGGGGGGVGSGGGGDGDGGGTQRDALVRVLRAYAIHDTEARHCLPRGGCGGGLRVHARACRVMQVGYSSGMSFIAALFLNYQCEEDAFQLLVAVFNEAPHAMRAVFLPGRARVREMLDVLRVRRA